MRLLLNSVINLKFKLKVAIGLVMTRKFEVYKLKFILENESILNLHDLSLNMNLISSLKLFCLAHALYIFGKNVEIYLIVMN